MNPFSKVSKKVIKKAWEYAVSDNESCARPCHLLKALLDTKDNEIVSVLELFIDDKRSLMNLLSEDVDLLRKSKKNNTTSKIKIGSNISHSFCDVTNKIIEAANIESEIKKIIDNTKVEIKPVHIFIGIIMISNELTEIFDKYGINYEDFVTFHHQLFINSDQTYTIKFEYDYIPEGEDGQLIAGDMRDLNDHSDNDSESKVLIDGTEHVLQTSAILRFCDNINIRVKEMEHPPALNREFEIDNCLTAMTRKQKNNIILVGESGVGKTVVAESLAWMIEKREVPFELQNKIIFELNLNNVVAGTKYRGQFEERMKNLLEEVKSMSNIILFIDEIHTIVGTGNQENGLDVSNILKSDLAKGNIQVIGATTFEEYQQVFEVNKPLERRFKKIIIEEPSSEDTVEILNKLKDNFEDYHSVHYDKEIIRSIVSLSDRFIKDRNRPDKAIDIMDELGALVKRSNKVPTRLKNKMTKLRENQYKFFEAFTNKNKEMVIEYKDKEEKARKDLIKEEKKYLDKLNENRLIIEMEDLHQVIADFTNMPYEYVSESLNEKILNVENNLNKHVINQKKGIKSISDTLKLNRLGLTIDKKPIGSFLFLGKSGVGKTHTAKCLSRELFGSDKILHLNMSEYMDSTSLSKMIGTSAGYIGYEEGGMLTNYVKENAYSIILVDEFEKAHKSIFNIFLSILDEGEILDGRKKLIDFSNCIILFTSNIGSNVSDLIGFGSDTTKVNIKKELGKKIPFELINRFDNIVSFNNLDKASLSKIYTIEIKKIKDKLKEKNIKLIITKATKQKVLDESFDNKFGARLLKRKIREHITIPMTESVLGGMENIKV